MYFIAGVIAGAIMSIIVLAHPKTRDLAPIRQAAIAFFAAILVGLPILFVLASLNR